MDEIYLVGSMFITHIIYVITENYDHIKMFIFCLLSLKDLANRWTYMVLSLKIPSVSLGFLSFQIAPQKYFPQFYLVLFLKGTLWLLCFDWSWNCYKSPRIKHCFQRRVKGKIKRLISVLPTQRGRRPELTKLVSVECNMIQYEAILERWIHK